MCLEKVYILQHGLEALFIEAYFALYCNIAHEVAWKSINNVGIACYNPRLRLDLTLIE